MRPIETSKGPLAGIVAAGGWLLLVGAVGAIIRGLSAPADDLAGRVNAEERPVAQLNSRPLDSQVWSLAFSPEGDRLAAATIAGNVWLVDRETEQASRVQAGLMGTAKSVLFSPDGSLLAVSGGGRKVRLWDLAAGTERRPLEVNAIQTKFLATSPDGSLLALSADWGESGPDSVTLFEWKGLGRSAKLVNDHPGVVNALGFSPDGRLLAVGDSAGYVTLWDVAERRRRFRLATHHHVESLLAFSPIGSRLATAGVGDGRVRFWDPTTGGSRGEVAATVDGVTRIAYSPDGTLLAIGSGKGSVRLWGVNQGRVLAVLRVPGGYVRSLLFSPDGKRIATGGSDGVLRTWNIGLALSTGEDGQTR